MRSSGDNLCKDFTQVPEFLRAGMTEIDLAAEFDARLRRAGGEGPVRMRAFNQELFGGLAVIVGFQTRVAATLLVIFTLGTAFIFHPFWVEGQWSTFWKEISMIGGLLLLAAVGPGELSVDGKK